MLDWEAISAASTLPELTEPPTHAMSSIIRSLQKVREQGPEAWMAVFTDLMDKAYQSPSTTTLQIVAAAAVSAPAEVRVRARRSVAQFEAVVAKRERVRADAWALSTDSRSVLLVIPKKRELAAAREVFGFERAPTGHLRTHARYWERSLQLRSGEPARMVMLCLQAAGNPQAAAAVRDFQDAFGRPDVAILSGMAMGIPESPDGRPRIEVGDVVVADKVYDYEPARVTKEGRFSRFEPFRVRGGLLQDLQQHASDLTGFADLVTSAHRNLRDDHEAPGGLVEGFVPDVKIGGVLAGEELVEDESGRDRAALQDRIAALEMESAGFAAACDHTGVPWLVVRGIADFGNEDRDKRWQVFAAAGAMAFAKSFLEHEFIPASAEA